MDEFLSVLQIEEEADIDLEQKQIRDERNKIIAFRELLRESCEKVATMEADIEKLNSDIAEGIMNGAVIDDLVLRRSMLRESLADVRAVPVRIENKIKELERTIKGIESVIFRKVTNVLKVERVKRVEALTEAIKTSCADWLETTRELSKGFSGGLIPAGWSNFRGEILTVLDSVYGTTGSHFRG